MSGIKLKGNKKFIESLDLLQEDRKVSKEFIIDVLKEAIVKTFQKHIDAPAAVVRVEIDDAIRVYHELVVVADEDENYDETLDIPLSDALLINKLAKVGDTISIEVDFNEIGRSSITVAKNMLKQKIKEHEKQRIYEIYKDRVYDLVTGTIKTVEEKFILVDLKDTIGIMLKAEQIPGEVYREEQVIHAVIKDVQRNSRGSQVALSRADAMFVKRLFEREVPEISHGEVEIKAIAREAGERCKMAVYSRNEDIDAIGACIGPRGGRVQEVISEIKGEKIDIFEWNNDIGELVKNALAPAEVLACFYADENYEGLSDEEIERKKKRHNRPLYVVVKDEQLSLAIGKRGQNAKLAVKLTDRKIDIKTYSATIEAGIDIESKEEEFKVDQERIRKERLERELLANQEEVAKRKAIFEETLAKEGDAFLEESLDEMVDARNLEKEVTIVDLDDEDLDEEVKEDTIETIETNEEIEEPTMIEETKVEKVQKTVKTRERKTEYVSKFEDFADASKKDETDTKSVKRKRKKEEERRLRPNELKRDKDYEYQVEYSEEELEEIEAMEEMEESNSWINDDIDFDEYDDYYNEER